VSEHIPSPDDLFDFERIKRSEEEAPESKGAAEEPVRRRRVVRDLSGLSASPVQRVVTKQASEALSVQQTALKQKLRAARKQLGFKEIQAESETPAPAPTVPVTQSPASRRAQVRPSAPVRPSRTRSIPVRPSASRSTPERPFVPRSTPERPSVPRSSPARPPAPRSVPLPPSASRTVPVSPSQVSPERVARRKPAEAQEPLHQWRLLVIAAGATPQSFFLRAHDVVDATRRGAREIAQWMRFHRPGVGWRVDSVELLADVL